MALIDEIQAKCSPELIAAQEHGQIAAIVSQGRTRVQQPYLVGKGTIADALGIPGGAVFIRSLRMMAEAVLPAEATAEQVADKALVELAWELINRENFDVGLPGTRAALDAFVGKMDGFTQVAADIIKGLAVTDDPVSVAQVIEAMKGA